MAGKRIIYILMLLATLAALVLTNNGIALFLFMCVLVLPLISMVMVFIARRHVRFELKVRESCIRGGALQITMCASVKPRFFVGGIRVTTEIENTTFHKTEYRRFMFNDLSFAPHVYNYNGTDSGRISIKCTSLQITGIFGMLALKVKCSAYAEAIVSPVLYEDVGVNVGELGSRSIFGDRPLPRKGIDTTEIFNVRDYVPGDSLSAVHWKLSGKFDELKAKDFGATDDRRLLILVDLSRSKFDSTATDAQLNAALDVAISVSNALKSVGYAHSIGWFDDGLFMSAEVSDNNSFVAAVDKLMSVKVNEGNAENLFYLSRTAECSSFTKIVYISSVIHYTELQQSLGAEITAIEIGDEYGETIENGVRIINIPYNDIGAALTACAI